jgi:ankyrin repeat protein
MVVVASCFLLILLATLVSSFCPIAVDRKKRIRSQPFFGAASAGETGFVDNRPHAARATSPRQARRVNHAFKHLYRHLELDPGDEAISAVPFLIKYANLTEEQITTLNATFPPLLTLDVKRHLFPKLLFLQRTLRCTSVASIPPSYFGSRLERIVAPRHAFMVKQGLLEHHALSADGNFQRFLMACRTPQAFAAFCNGLADVNVTTIQVEAWDMVFQRGLLSACRMDVTSSWTMEYANNDHLEELLISHGANPLEQSRGATLLHWACGSGNLDAVKCLLPYIHVNFELDRDGAIPMHWAAAGANVRGFGVGGHADVCQFLLTQVDDAKAAVNHVTKDGNSVLMWAAWSGTLPVVKWLIRNRADALVTNRNGCTVAHWAASGGSLETCRYLKDVVGLDFTSPNYGGNTPLTHAVAFGRVEIVDWLRREVEEQDNIPTALELAQDFVQWTEGDETRKQVLSLLIDQIEL